MVVKIIPQKKVLKLLDLLKERYDVFAPQEQEGEVIFSSLTEPSRIVLNYKTAVLPPKLFFLPPEEELFTVKGGQAREAASPKPFVIFGLNLKDLAGICQLDEIMGQEPADSFYHKRRGKALLIAVSDKGVGIPPGGDLILEKIGNIYRAITPSRKGKEITDLPVFERKEIKTRPQPAGKQTKLEALLLDSELLARAVEWSRENYPQIWERLGKICLGCGICTYVCPLCYCFEMEDQTSLDQSVCTRCRYWSACTLPGFATVAGGHNFRPILKDRYFNWYYHKFVRAYKEFGQAQCVACGRCQKYCPAGIDLEKVLVEIITEFQKAHPVREF
jgi:sulfhydrogenase subunit beta (sulfur reductase)